MLVAKGSVKSKKLFEQKTQTLVKDHSALSSKPPLPVIKEQKQQSISILKG